MTNDIMTSILRGLVAVVFGAGLKNLKLIINLNVIIKIVKVHLKPNLEN